MATKRILREIVVTTRPGRRTEGLFTAGHITVRCALGRSGICARKREGDGATPLGVWPIREAFYRADRIVGRPQVVLALRKLRRLDGWCDAPGDRNYNRFVSHPYPASAEELWRADGLYDVILVVGYNDKPRSRGKGSAIFIHAARELPEGSGFAATEGCVALPIRELLRVLPLIGRTTRLRVRG